MSGKTKSDKIKIVAEERKEFGKGASRRARVGGKIPAVLYGSSTEPVHLLLPAHETTMSLKHSNAIFELEVGGKKHDAIAKAVQVHPVKSKIVHIDFIALAKGERIRIEVPINIVGEPAPRTIVIREMQSVEVETDSTNLLESVSIDIDGIEAGNSVFAGEIALPKTVVLLTNEKYPVVSAQAQGKEEEEEKEESEESEEEETSEPETKNSIAENSRTNNVHTANRHIDNSLIDNVRIANSRTANIDSGMNSINSSMYCNMNNSTEGYG
jgi:large subunit ribosomal protein L25